MRIIIASGGTCLRQGYGLAYATRRFKGFYSQLSASSLELASKLKAEPQALRPAPALLSFYPAEKKMASQKVHPTALWRFFRTSTYQCMPSPLKKHQAL